jgi:hypothetical protein
MIKIAILFKTHTSHASRDPANITGTSLYHYIGATSHKVNAASCLGGGSCAGVKRDRHPFGLRRQRKKCVLKRKRTAQIAGSYFST